jgi:hypothetical protein
MPAEAGIQAEQNNNNFKTWIPASAGMTPFPPIVTQSRGMVRVGVIRAQIFTAFFSHPPHPNPLPQGARGFPDEDWLNPDVREAASRRGWMA